jgi:hypothetical protein
MIAQLPEVLEIRNEVLLEEAEWTELRELSDMDEFVRKKGCRSFLNSVTSEEDEPADSHAVSCGGEEIRLHESDPIEYGRSHVVIHLDLVGFEVASLDDCGHGVHLAAGVVEGRWMLGRPTTVGRSSNALANDMRVLWIDVFVMVAGMWNACAKPTCTDSAHVWLDFAPGEQRVIERSVRGDASVGLCATHAARFTVPTGWTFDRTTEQQTTAPITRTTPVPAAEGASPQDGHLKRAHTRDRPWFLGLTDTASESVDGEPHSDLQRATTDDPVDAMGEPTIGSLLHRAFHGPDRSVDANRAALDELEHRRATRIDDDEPGTIELPFPPFEPEHRVAIS